MTLPTDHDERNAIPVWDGFIAYFPDVPAAVAEVSLIGNKQHNIGAKLFWNREVSTDHANKVFRHMLDDLQGTYIDTDGTYHLAKAVWRLCAMLQLRIEAHEAPRKGLRPRCRTESPPTEGAMPSPPQNCVHGYTKCARCSFP